MTRAVAEPTREPVHQLRTFARRVEAQLILLDLLVASGSQLPEHAREAKRARRHLRRVRRAAGAVRDLDVERKLVKETAQTGSADGSRSGKLQKQGRELRRHLKRRRNGEANALLRMLHPERHKLSPALDALLRALEPASELEVSPEQLERLAVDWYQARTSQHANMETPDGLHGIRKAAKLARYMAENASSREGDKAGALAASLNALQDAGGAWHDLLTLAETAAGYLGRRSVLARRLRARRNDSMGEYRACLSGFSLQFFLRQASPSSREEGEA